jgi:hypothetical protein
MQSFIEKVNTDINPLSDKAGSEVSAKLSQSIREIMDKKISESTGEGYQKLRNSYSDLKSIENNIVNQFKKAAGKGTSKFGSYIEGYGDLDTILGVLSHNPIEMARGVGLNIISRVVKYMKDPEVNLQNIFKQLEDSTAKSPTATRVFGGAKPPTQ